MKIHFESCVHICTERSNERLNIEPKSFRTRSGKRLQARLGSASLHRYKCILAPLKKKLLRANNSQYVTKALRKAVMRRSKLEKIYFRNQTNESLKAYRKQRHYCRKRYRKERKKFSDNLKLIFNLISEVSPNFRLDEEVLKTSWIRLSSSSLEDVFRFNHPSSEDVFKTSWSRTLYLSWPSVFKTSSGRLTKMSSKHLQDDFKTPCEISSRCFQDVVKTFRRRHGLRKIITLKTCWRPTNVGWGLVLL